ncbi:class II fumarate hydratase [Ruminococcus sp.]|uniref:class II fumarate hydratase n=1 Tax=Ruminococcus sp. TaxID=41978 RepID=UPI003F06CD10
MEYRIEHDSMGEMQVPADRLWAAQTQRSHQNFKIGVDIETMPREITHAFGILKKAAALANAELKPEKMTAQKLDAISQACDEVISGALNDHFPLVVWQTGSGTQSNMNANEVIANRANQIAGEKLCHPNDDINMSQSSNDTFPTAMHISAVLAIEDKLLPAVDALISTFRRLEAENEGIVKSGRTHLQDATPIKFSQEISGWRASLEKDAELLKLAVKPLHELALGGTAVGTGLNAPAGFSELVAKKVAELTGKPFITAENKFHALTSKDELVFAHGAIKATACDMMKIANDVRWLASGPRDGLGEIHIPENEPGSSIMPGKVNPTQCEAVTMVAVQVMGNDVAVGMAASQGNFELNVFMPVAAYNFLQSARLLAEAMVSFNVNCAVGITANKDKMYHNLHNSLMLVTALNPYIGYENAAKTAKKAFKENISLKEACVALGFLTAERFDEVFHPEQMV